MGNQLETSMETRSRRDEITSWKHLCRLFLQRCFQLVISSLLDLVSRDVSNWLFLLFWTLFQEMFSTGYFVSSGDYHDLTRTQKITTILLELKRSNKCSVLFWGHCSLSCSLFL